MSKKVNIKKKEILILENGLCFLEESIIKLKEDKPKNMKYVILHLFAGVFLILKTRLYQEHWSLLFDDINKAIEEDFKLGNFKGVNFSDCLKRLENISNLRLESTKLIHLLRKKRNKIEHFFEDENLDASKSTVVKVLSFTFNFIKDNLKNISKESQEKIKTIQEMCSDIDKYVDERLKEIAPKLEKEKITLLCPSCSNKSLIANENKHLLECLFCNSQTDPSNYEEISYYNDYNSYFDSQNSFCSQCEAENSFVDTNNQDEYLCLNCFYTDDKESLNQCIRCGTIYAGTLDTFCDICFRDIINKN